jgi:hypothetical protein
MIPATGTISLLQIIKEFTGTTTPKNLLSYYNGGSEVSNTYGQIVNIPSSGKLNIRKYAGNQWMDGVLQYSGSGTETVPSGAGNVTIEAWGSGGGGGYYSGGAQDTVGSGGGSGGYALTNVACTSGQTFSYVCGTGGLGGSTAGSAGSRGTTNTSVSGATITTMHANNGAGGTAAFTPDSAGGTAAGGNIKNLTGGAGVEGGTSFSGPGGLGSGGSVQPSVFDNTPYGNYQLGPTGTYGQGGYPSTGGTVAASSPGGGGSGSVVLFSGAVEAASGQGGFVLFTYFR